MCHDLTTVSVQVLCPLASIPIMIGIGLNYRVHAEEAGVSYDPYIHSTTWRFARC